MKPKVAQTRLVEAWKDVPEGTPVMFRKVKGGPEFSSKTTSGPFLLGGHTACIMLDGVSGAFCLEFVRKETVISCKKSDVDEGLLHDDFERGR
jgi:hypothetical protein